MGYIVWGIIWLVLGIVLFLAGTLEWKPWQNPLRLPEKKRAMICAGVIAVGGLLTTKGWNDFSAYGQRKAEEAFNQSLQKTNQQFKQDLDERDQRFKADQKERDLQLRRDAKKALILAVAREWRVNELNRFRKPLYYYEHGDFDKLYASTYIVPTYQNSIFRVAGASDLQFVKFRR